MDYDVAIIGGGPGGASAAIYLRNKGYHVALFERELFPRDHVGESLIPFCYYRLKELGVVDEIMRYCTRKPGVNFVDRDGLRESTWCFDKVIEGGASISFHMLRAPFDHAILKRARALGAEVFEQNTVTSVDLTQPEEVTLSVKNQTGELRTVKARFLIDASGQDSFLGKKLGNRIKYAGLERTALFTHWIKTTYDDALNGGLIKIAYLGGEKMGWIWVIPVGRNHLSVGVTLNNDYVRHQKQHFNSEDWKEKLYLQEISESVPLKAILKGAEQEHAVQITADYSYKIRQKHSTNYVAIGDAGAFLDPIFSSGILIAFETAKKAASCIDITIQQGCEAGMRAFDEAAVDIEGGYTLTEKFVRLFYDPKLLNFSHVSVNDDGFQRFQNAYEVFHYLLAGDFFTHYKKYTDFLDTLTREKNFNQFVNYVKNKADEFIVSDHCSYTFEEVYGHLPETDQVGPGMLHLNS